MKCVEDDTKFHLQIQKYLSPAAQALKKLLFGIAEGGLDYRFYDRTIHLAFIHLPKSEQRARKLAHKEPMMARRTCCAHVMYRSNAGKIKNCRGTRAKEEKRERAEACEKGGRVGGGGWA